MPKTLEQSIRELQTLKGQIKKIAANEMVNFALDNIKNESWEGQRWKSRNPKATRNQGRKLLVDTGDGRRSITAKETSTGAQLTANKYMQAHNEGVNKTVGVRAHSRTRKGRSERVKSFTRKMNLPQRQFTGKSQTQTNRIEKIIANRIAAALT
jgi:phage gpG-like protein